MRDSEASPSAPSSESRRDRSEHPRAFWLGCAVWSFRGWLGKFYPADSSSKDFLRLYGDRFTTVEGNTTFYAVPDTKTITRWASETPPGFKFCLKLHRDITHRGAIMPHLPAALDFCDRVRGLGDRLGPTFMQLPPSYSPAYLDDLQEVVQAWPHHDVPLAIEVRHLAWWKSPYAERLHELMQELHISRVLLDTRTMYDGADDPQVHSQRRKPKVPLVPELTTDTAFVRFISHPEGDRNLAYLQEWRDLVNAWLRQGKQVYFFVHCPDERRSPDTARSFQRMLERVGAPIPPLPWDSASEPANQLTLF
ncbi:MAG: DUF72 domain-containing protein [Cyanobacteria bacterium P01_D01_bin.123]